MRLLLACAAMSAATALAGCGDNLKPAGDVDAATVDTPDIDTPIDARPPDAMVDASCPSRTAGSIGGPCTTDTQCDSTAGAGDGFCLTGAVGGGSITWPTQGYCVNQIDTCTATSCGTGNQCTTINDPLGAFRACLPACGTGACVCSDGQLCAGSFSGSDLGTGQMACLPGNGSSTDGAVCTGFGECTQDSLCQNDPFEYPNGECATIGCTIGNDATCAPGGDGHCVDLGALTSGQNTGTICVDRCTTEADCRTADGFHCVDGGGTIGKYCRHPHIGDPCTLDGQCGDAATWRCSLVLPGGSCTPRAACPTPGAATGCAVFSSVCWEGLTPAGLDNECVDRCGGPVNTQGGCRTGLTCRDVDPQGGATHVVLACVP